MSVAMGYARVDAFVLEKPEPRHSKDGKTTYYNLTIGDVGWKQRIPCSFPVYTAVLVTTPDRPIRYSFKGKLEPSRATRAGSNFADDMQQMTLEGVNEFQSAPAPQQQSAPAPQQQAERQAVGANGK